MANLNIGGQSDDAFYRYKMPKLISKIEGKGNGIKTVIPNMSDIARALSRPSTYPTKYFGCELGAQVKCDEKTDRYIVNGAHDAAKLQQLLNGFIQKFVLCPSCGNPETDIIVDKTSTIMMYCNACGRRNKGENVHKLATYIVKNPPVNSAYGKKGKGEKADKKSKKNGTSTPPEEEEEDQDDDFTKKIKEEAAAIPDADHYKSALGDDWSVDTSAEGTAARMKELEGNVKTQLTLDDDDEEEDGENPYELFGIYLEENPKATDAEIMEKANELNIVAKSRAVTVLVQCIFTDDMAREIKTRSSLLRKFVVNEKNQKALLGGMERVLVTSKTLMLKAPLILKAFYDNDILEEDVILKWGEKPTKKYVSREEAKDVRTRVEPFLRWLAEAESEEDSEEEDE
ncbi:translation initiation factor [Lobosporangium transversale]|uniref:Translation initiation factor n=1 Tax=Lobosporangium transversale TaxID=64571 RepID=A0A1Y2H242_9FUNG|nr:translation initiation factor [Lobosporangium transversale]ORZ28640.1 translation initiation factor [Lobosporangium transversale]|eukprot:XP_021886313.1 translation initiation factor [Lobosporangium transversale]